MEYTIRLVKPDKDYIEVEYADGKDEARAAVTRLQYEFTGTDFKKVQAINERGNVCFSQSIPYKKLEPVYPFLEELLVSLNGKPSDIV